MLVMSHRNQINPSAPFSNLYFSFPHPREIGNIQEDRHKVEEFHFLSGLWRDAHLVHSASLNLQLKIFPRKRSKKSNLQFSKKKFIFIQQSIHIIK